MYQAYSQSTKPVYLTCALSVRLRFRVLRLAVLTAADLAAARSRLRFSVSSLNWPKRRKRMSSASHSAYSSQICGTWEPLVFGKRRLYTY